ncbi:hypothetical protein SAMN05421734_103336 [Pelagirhabdus alkalitolerans]|uniref:Uncharacterized protein n=1 Tax=Pelagirhabdus alkalitolerans TaxID=1612202 RepID=A0A1G6I398_9BACI|nr:hypothetical protein [Pelagirhabdus alkalitolerans]SDC00878.1 hypothetical protein SAMN05421734_103336 [Pelagirhabdus alkalitolerans]
MEKTSIGEEVLYMSVADLTQIIINSLILFIYFFMLYENVKMTKETKLMTLEAKETREQAYRPEVIAFIKEENELLYFCIKNTGVRTAFDTHLLIPQFFNNTSFDGRKEVHEKFFTKVPNSIRDVEKSISLLAPGQSLQAFMGVRQIIFEKNAIDLNRTVKLTYSNSEGNLYIEEYTISVGDFSKVSHFKENHLKEIAHNTRLISEKMPKQND